MHILSAFLFLFVISYEFSFDSCVCKCECIFICASYDFECDSVFYTIFFFASTYLLTEKKNILFICSFVLEWKLSGGCYCSTICCINTVKTIDYILSCAYNFVLFFFQFSLLHRSILKSKKEKKRKEKKFYTWIMYMYRCALYIMCTHRWFSLWFSRAVNTRTNSIRYMYKYRVLMYIHHIGRESKQPSTLNLDSI